MYGKADEHKILEQFYGFFLSCTKDMMENHDVQYGIQDPS